MTGIVHTITGLGSGSIARDADIGYVGRPVIPHNPAAFYLLGTRLGAPGLDLSGWGRHARRVGNPTVGALYAVGTSNDHCFETPLTGDEAASFDEVCLVAISRAPQASEVVAIGNYVDGVITSTSLGLPNGYLVRSYAMNPTRRSEIASDADRGDRWTFTAANFTTTSTQVFERRYGEELQAGPLTTFDAQPIGGTARIRLGGCPSPTTFLGTQDIIGGGIFKATLTTDQIDEIYDYLSPLLMAQGEVV